MSKISVEQIKAESNGLRGSISAELAEPTEKFSDESVQLLKFHGIYQQDDRDERRAARERGQERDWQFMLRLRLPAGRIPAATWLAVDDLADRHGNGTIRVTTREGVQLHGVRKRDLKATIADVNAHLGSTLAACGDVSRNVMAPPWPLATPAHRVARETAEAIADAVAPRTHAYVEIWQDGERVDGGDEEPLYGTTYLPRKFKIAVTVPGDDAVEIFSQDLAVVPVLRGERVIAFELFVGGGLGRTHGKDVTYARLADPLGSVLPERLIDAVKAVIAVQRDFGDRTDRRHARLKYLIGDRGIAWFRERVEEYAGFELDPPRELPPWQSPSFLGWHAQGDGRWFYGLHVPSGRVRDDGPLRRRSAIRVIVERLAIDLAATPDQNLLFVGVDDADRGAVDAILAEHGVPAPDAIGALEQRALACPALPTCGLALAESERVLPNFLAAIDAVRVAAGVDEPVQIRTTGCPNGCARPYVAEIGIVGVSAGRYDVHLGGGRGSSRLAPLWMRAVPAAEIPVRLGEVFERFARERTPGEPFGDFCTRAVVTPEAVPA